MEQQHKPHDAVRVISGKYAGLVGNVVEVRPAGVRVKLVGTVNDEPIDTTVQFKPSQLEAFA